MVNSLDETIWLTPAARGRLQAEFDDLTRVGAESSPATEARIRELRNVLRYSEVDDKPDDGLVEPGMLVTVSIAGEPDPVTFLMGQREIAERDPEVDVDIYPPGSPLGRAIAGRYPGDAFRYTTPSGATVRGRVVAAVPFRTNSMKPVP